MTYNGAASAALYMAARGVEDERVSPIGHQGAPSAVAASERGRVPDAVPAAAA